jgi:hypothetical protein
LQHRWDPQLTDFLEDHVARLHCTLQHAREGHVEADASLSAEHPRTLRIVEAVPAKRHVHPRREAVVLVPDWYAVPHQDEADQVILQIIQYLLITTGLWFGMRGARARIARVRSRTGPVRWSTCVPRRSRDAQPAHPAQKSSMRIYSSGISRQTCQRRPHLG